MDYTLTPSLNPHPILKSTTPISSLKWINCSILIALFKTSASYFWVLQWTTLSTPSWTWFLGKWNFVSMYLLLPWTTELLARLIFDLLSIINFTCFLTLIFRSWHCIILLNPTYNYRIIQLKSQPEGCHTHQKQIMLRNTGYINSP